MNDLTNELETNKAKLHVDIVHALTEKFVPEIISIVHDDMFKIVMDDETEDYMAIVKYDLGLVFLYKMRIQKFELGGTLITTEVIGDNTNVFELVGNGEGGLKLRVANVNYIFRTKESFIK